jgi:hypothetical protein|tara:strand:- start:2202 stop:2330 length:129 start_codon:yes stop_codon:yes gene_type:complete
MAKKVWTHTPEKKTQHKRHAKSKTSHKKGTDNYIKKYRGQGR